MEKNLIRMAMVAGLASVVVSCKVDVTLPETNVAFEEKVVGDSVERVFKVEAFKELDLVMSSIECEYAVSDSFGLRMVAKDSDLKGLSVYFEDEVLSVGCTEVVLVPGASSKIRMYVTAPSSALRELQIMGAASFVCRDTMLVEGGEVNVELAGAGTLKLAAVGGKTVNFDLSGACNIDVSVLRSEDVYVDASGAVKANVRMVDCVNSYIDMSGAGKLEVDFAGECKEAFVEMSGVGVAKLSGKLKELDLDSSGVSSVDRNNLTVTGEEE